MKAAADPDDRSSSEAPELPGLRTWRAVYALVLASFLLWVGLLAVLAWTYS